MELTKNYLWKFMLVAGLCAVGCYFAIPSPHAQDVFGAVVGFASVLCILGGILLYRPEDRTSWFLLAAGSACFFVAEGVWNLYRIVLARPIGFPSVVDGVYLAGYVLTFLAVMRLSRNPNRSARREDYADAAIVTIGALALMWHFFMGPEVHNPSLHASALGVTVAYSVMDIVLVFVVFRALVFGLEVQHYQGIIAAALLDLFLGDFTYGLLVTHGGYKTGSPADAWYLLEFVLMGVAALHPSVGDPIHIEPKRVPNVYNRDTNGQRRLPFVAFAGFVPAAILLVTSVLMLPVDVPFMAASSLAVVALMYLRMMWLIGRITGQTNEVEVHARALEASHRRARLPRGGPTTPCLPRRAHWTRQPGPAPRPGRARSRRLIADRTIRRPVLRRPRRVQDGQRHHGPRHRRHGAPAGQSPPHLDRASRRHRGPAWWGRVRGAHGRRRTGGRSR